MYTETKQLRIVCPTNPDYNTVFNKEDIEQKMKELDIIGNWMEYALEHEFADEPEFTDKLCSIFNFANVRKVTLQFGDDWVAIEKIK